MMRYNSVTLKSDAGHKKGQYQILIVNDLVHLPPVFPRFCSLLDGNVSYKKKLIVL